MDGHARQSTGAFAWWLRTGRLPRVITPDGVELKFNPYHDPANGQFTFGPGGASAFSGALRGTTKRLKDNLAAEPAEPMARGGHARAFEDPMTLEQSFPGLRDAPGGAIVAVADNFFNFWGPATEAQAALLDNWTQQEIADIKAIDPHYPLQSLGPPLTIAGKASQLDGLRWTRANLLLRTKGDVRPLQVETFRFMQQQADQAYDEGMALLKAGRLMPRLSQREALGNYIDGRVRRALRHKTGFLPLISAESVPVRVNRRENDTSGSELTYRPDARVGDVAFDVTITRKNLATPQVRGFFGTDFRPALVVIVRPRQLGTGHSYVISRPGKR